MNIRRGLFRLWIVVSAVLVLGSGIVWYQGFTTKQKQIASLDECGKIYPPLPEGLVTLNSKPFDPDYCVGKAATCNIFDQFDEPPAQPSLLSQFQADSAAADSERAAEKQHPHCAPNVGTINFLNFVSMHVSWSWEIGQGVKVYSSSDKGIRDDDETAVYV